jgi:hypothetical protein
MTGLSTAGEAAVIAPLTTTAYVSLHTGDPGNTGANEITGGAYGRLGPITFEQVSGPNPTVQGNQAILTFNAATAAWGLIAYFGLWIGTPPGVFYGASALTVPQTINAGDTARFLAHALTITVD